MKVSLNWVREFTDVQLSVDELVTKIGAQLGAVEEVIDLGKKYRGIVIAKVVACEKHTNADKLQVCLIDDGGKANDVNRDESGYVQVVCGAPNVREGLLVAWLPPGTTVPSTYDKDPLTLEAREIRGVVSNGMLASAHELALSDNHDGILELNPNDAKPGDDFAKTYKLDDYIIDIENKMFTHRPDCFGQLGVAREIAGIQQQAFTSPDWYLHGHRLPTVDKDELPLDVRVECPELVPRFMAVAMKNVEITPSPVWLQACLSRVGIKSINNIVDMTNYVMHVTGQPLHAYDYDKVRALSCEDAAELIAKKAKTVDSIALLNGKTVEFADPTVLITTSVQPIGVAGVMGGAGTEVDNETQNIIIECANFDMYNIRKTSMKYGLATEAVTRFNKGQSMLQNDRVLAMAMDLATKLSGAQVASNIYDIHLELEVAPVVTVSTKFVNERLGLELSAEEIATLLTNVEFAVEINDTKLLITPPFWRTDIEIPEDIVEEVGRLYGYDHLPLDLPRRDLTPAKKDVQLELKKRVREVLKSAGANEVLTYSFVHGNLLEKAGQKTEDSYQLSNALSPDLQYYRQTLTPSLLDKVHPNIKAGHDEFALFELNKTHNKIHGLDDEQVPGELNMIAFTYATKQKSGGAAYYQARKFLDYLVGTFGFSLAYQIIKESPGYPVTQPFDFKRSALVTIKEGGIFLGIIGEYRAEVATNFKLPARAAGFEIGLEGLLEAVQKSSSSVYQELPRFPRVSQDMSLKVPAALTYGELHEFIWTKIDELKPLETLATLEPVDIYQRDDDKEHKQITLRLSTASYERTLIAEEVNKLLDAVATQAKEKFSAARI